MDCVSGWKWTKYRLKDGTRVAALPWEFLCLPGPPPVLAAHPGIAFSRFIALSHPASRPARIHPLVVLFAGPRPPELTPVFSETARESIEERLGEEIRDRRVRIEEQVGSVTKTGLMKWIEDKTPHVLHFMGHAEFRDSGGRLALQDGNGALEYLEQVSWRTSSWSGSRTWSC